MTEQILTQSTLHNLLNYDRETGIFTWLIRNNFSAGDNIFNSRYAGKISGHTCLDRQCGKKYIQIRVNNKLYKAHRLAWLYVHGEFPQHDIDHLDGDGTNNSICNLKSVTHSVNGKNLRMPKTNTSGIVGVQFNIEREKWVARIMVSFKNKTLGYFDNKTDAIICRKMAEYKYGFNKNHGSMRKL